MTARPLFRPAAVTLISLAAITGCAVPPQPPEKTHATEKKKDPRSYLPDLSEGLAGLVGPFLWARSADLGAELRFCDRNGAPKSDGDYLWLYQFKRLEREVPPSLQLHERNNLENLDQQTAYDVQICHILLNHPLEYVFKLIVGYKQAQPRFQHGDNTDLVHLAGAERVCVFLPIRSPGSRGRPHKSADIADQQKYWINTEYQMDAPCVIEFKANEAISHKWFDPKNLDPHILFDLAPHLEGDNRIYPGVTKPVFRFTIDGKGGWQLLIEPDGRDGLAGGARDDDWDLSFSHKSPGAKPYTVNVTQENSTWAMSTFSPGGKPEESSEAIVGLKPFNRRTGRTVPWADRSKRIRTFYLDELGKVLGGAAATEVRQPGMKPKSRPDP